MIKAKMTGNWVIPVVRRERTLTATGGGGKCEECRVPCFRDYPLFIIPANMCPEINLQS